MPSAILSVFLMALLASACGPLPGQTARTPPVTPIPVSVRPVESDGGANAVDLSDLDGPGLYEKLCSSCHGALEQTAVARASASMIKEALAAIADMKKIPPLSETQITLVADQLAKIPPGKAKGKP